MLAALSFLLPRLLRLGGLSKGGGGDLLPSTSGKSNTFSSLAMGDQLGSWELGRLSKDIIRLCLLASSAWIRLGVPDAKYTLCTLAFSSTVKDPAGL